MAYLDRSKPNLVGLANWKHSNLNCSGNRGDKVVL